MAKKAKKTKAQMDKVLKALSPKEKKARAAKLAYNNVKTKLVSRGLYAGYLADAVAGKVPHGGSLAYMKKLLKGKPPTSIKVEVGSPTGSGIRSFGSSSTLRFGASSGSSRRVRAYT